MLKYIFIFLYIFQLCLDASHARNIKSKELEKISLQLHWKYQFEFAGFIAAKEKGFYKDAGLDVELKEYKNGINIEKEILSGKSEYGIYNSLSLLEYLRGKNLKLVSSYFKRAALVLVTSPDIKSPRDLVGKKVMVSNKDDFILNFKPYFDAYNVDINQIHFVKHTYNIEAFADKDVVAMTAFISNELYKLNERGIKFNVLDPSDENLYVLQLELVTSVKETKKHPMRVVAFREASRKGWEYALSHKNEIIDIIYNKYTQRISKKHLSDEAIGIEKLILPYTYNIGSIDKNFLDKQVNLFKVNYNIGLNKTIDNFIFDEKKHFVNIQFSKEELKYIQNNKVIDVCVNYSLFPLDGIVDGKMTGIMADIFADISKNTSLTFHPVASISELELQKNIQENKCELLSIVATNNKNYPTLNYSKVLSTTTFAVLSKLDKSFVSDVKQLKGKILLVQKKSVRDYLKHLYPFLSIEVEFDKNKIVKRVLNNSVYAIVTINEQADYFIDKYGYGKLKINAFLAKNHPIKGSIGIQKNNPILLSIINKSLKRISKDKINKIENSWRITRYQKNVDYSLVFKVIATMSLILLVMIYYHKKLKNLVRKKTKELREVNDYLEETVAQKIEELIKKDEILTTQSKQAVMGEMISMIAHQWRQPLNTITLSISNIQIKQMFGEILDKQELNDSLEEISNTIIYLSETIDDFKTYFHPDKEKNWIKVDNLIERAVNFILPRINANKIILEYIKSPTIEIEAYENELIQVLLNIIHNAIDAYSEIIVKDKKIIISTELKNNNIYISIEDRANGIKKENLKQIFEPYFSTKGKNGTGLGLYMSQMIIEKQFKGHIEIKTSGKGTTFIVMIPIISHF